MKLRLLLIQTCFLLLLDMSRVEVDALADECKAIAAVLMKKQMKIVSECTSSLKFKDTKEKKAKASCIMKCVMERIGAIGKNGQLDKESSTKFLKEHLGSLWEKLEELMAPCQEFAKGVDPNEELCKSYDPMVKCGTNAFMQLCKA